MNWSNERHVIETANVQMCELPWQKQGLSFTASGYGNRIPTSWKVKLGGLWRRVYCVIHSNVGTCYVMTKGEKHIVDFEAPAGCERPV